MFLRIAKDFTTSAENHRRTFVQNNVKISLVASEEKRFDFFLFWFLWHSELCVEFYELFIEDRRRTRGDPNKN